MRALSVANHHRGSESVRGREVLTLAVGENVSDYHHSAAGEQDDDNAEPHQHHSRPLVPHADRIDGPGPPLEYRGFTASVPGSVPDNARQDAEEVPLSVHQGHTRAMEEVLIREARADDQPALQRIFRRASLNNVGDRDALLAHPEALQLSDGVLRRGRARVAILTDGTVIGYVSTGPSGPGLLELEDLFVDPDWQRHGAARRLVAHVVAEAVTERVVRIDVTANDHALAFYRYAGFEEDSRVNTGFGVGTRMHVDVIGPSSNERHLPFASGEPG